MSAQQAERRGRAGSTAVRQSLTIGALVVLLLPTSALAASDPHRGQQYGLDRIEAARAWNVSTGSGVLVAIVDSGVDFEHEDLEGRLLDGRDFTGLDERPTDEVGHGTAVAGVVGAATGNERGISGVAPSARMLPLRVIDEDGTTSESAVARAVSYAVQRAQREGMRLVVNLSLADLPGLGTFTAAGGMLEPAVRQAYERGAVVVFAAGLLQPSLRERLRDVSIWVGASDARDERAVDSGVVPDVLAPGVAIVTTAYDPKRPESHDLYTCEDDDCKRATASGTSYAAAHVSGIGAMLLAQGLGNEAVLERIAETSDVITGGPGCGARGACRRVNAARATGATTPPPSGAPEASPASPPVPPAPIREPAQQPRDAKASEPRPTVRPDRLPAHKPVAGTGSAPVGVNVQPPSLQPEAGYAPPEAARDRPVSLLAMGALVTLASALAAGVWAQRSARNPARDLVRLGALDGIRGLAILAVALFHVLTVSTYGRPGTPKALWLVAAGNLGVDLFFVLSGFLLARSWWTLRRRHSSFPSAMGEYATNRALRILPAYWASLAILVPITAPALVQSVDGLRKLGLFASVQQFMTPELPWQVNGVTWSLTTEVQFYLLLPFVAALLAWAGPVAGAGLLVAASLAWRYFAHDWGVPPDWILGRIDQFAAGMAAWLVLARRTSGPSAVVRALRGSVGAWVVGASILAVAWYYGSVYAELGIQRSKWVEILVHPAMGVLIALGFVRVAEHGSRWLQLAPLRFLGVISFSLYLWHVPFLEAGVRLGARPGLEGVPVLLLLLVGAVAVSVVSFAYIEEPALRWRSRRPRPEPGEEPAAGRRRARTQSAVPA